MLFQKSFFSDAHKEQIIAAIVAAESLTSGEIRVHIEPRCDIAVLERALAVFYKLEMDKTEARNGVLIYIAYKDRKFAIIGDQGINAVVPSDFWDSIKTQMATQFRQGAFAEGTIHAIREAGKHLQQYFPHQRDDKNELSNDISEG